MADRIQESEEALERVNTLFERVTLWGVALVVILVAVLTLKNLAA
jgi:hypothetical protein